MASDMLVHTWEAPTTVSGCCTGRFTGEGHQCALAQHGGIILYKAKENSLNICNEWHAYDRLDRIMVLSIHGTSLFVPWAGGRLAHTVSIHPLCIQEAARTF
jgi:hypothetical protein